MGEREGDIKDCAVFQDPLMINHPNCLACAAEGV